MITKNNETSSSPDLSKSDVKRPVMTKHLLFPLEKLTDKKYTITLAVGTEHEKEIDCLPVRKKYFPAVDCSTCCCLYP